MSKARSTTAHARSQNAFNFLNGEHQSRLNNTLENTMFTASPTSSETQPASFAGCKLILVRISPERERERGGEGEGEREGERGRKGGREEEGERERESGREREGGREGESERGRGRERTPFEP